MHDVVVLRDRPVVADWAGRTEMDRLLVAQPFEIRPERIGAEEFGIARMKLRQRRRIGFLTRGSLALLHASATGAVHLRPFILPRAGSTTRSFKNGPDA